MAHTTSTGSPKKKLSASFTIFEDDSASSGYQVCPRTLRSLTQAALTPETTQPPLKSSSSAMPLTTSKLANQLPTQGTGKVRRPAHESLVRG